MDATIASTSTLSVSASSSTGAEEKSAASEMDTTIASTSTSSVSARTSTGAKVKVTSCVAKSTQFQVSQAKDGRSCRLCSFEADGQELNIHVRQHFTRWFCPCGISSATKAQIRDHIYGQRRLGNPRHVDVVACLEVDSSNFEKLQAEEKLPSTTVFGSLLQRSREPEVEKAKTAVTLRTPALVSAVKHVPSSTSLLPNPRKVPEVKTATPVRETTPSTSVARPAKMLGLLSLPKR